MLGYVTTLGYMAMLRYVAMLGYMAMLRSLATLGYVAMLGLTRNQRFAHFQDSDLNYEQLQLLLTKKSEYELFVDASQELLSNSKKK